MYYILFSVPSVNYAEALSVMTVVISFKDKFLVLFVLYIFFKIEITNCDRYDPNNFPHVC